MAMSGNQKTGQGPHAVPKRLNGSFSGRAAAAADAPAIKPQWTRRTRRP